MNIFEKIARRITRRSWNKTVHHIIITSMKRKVIDSHQAHAILGAWNRECFPEEGHAEYLKAVEHETHPTADEIISIENSVKSYLMNARHHLDNGDYKRAISFVDLAINETEYLAKHNAAQHGVQWTAGFVVQVKSFFKSLWSAVLRRH